MAEALGSILVLAGPTATGKTDAALELARRFDAELVGADSVQVYRGFDIGSAKPTPKELDGIAHHLIDIIDPNEECDSAGVNTASCDVDCTIPEGGDGLLNEAAGECCEPGPADDCLVDGEASCQKGCGLCDSDTPILAGVTLQLDI